MSDFDLDLGPIEDDQLGPREVGDVVVGVLDGDTPGEEWIEEVSRGNVLVLSVDGDLADLAAGFAETVRDYDGSLVHFRDFLIVTPPGIDVDTTRV